jgi:hypothetical protein
MSAFPPTWEEMHEAGYRFERRTRCRHCSKEIEWWTSPSGRWVPLDHAPEVGIFYVSHWIKCSGAQQARAKSGVSALPSTDDRARTK